MKKTLILQYQDHSECYAHRHRWYVCTEAPVRKLFPVLSQRKRFIKVVISDTRQDDSVEIIISRKYFRGKEYLWRAVGVAGHNPMFKSLSRVFSMFMHGDHIKILYVSITAIERRKQ